MPELPEVETTVRRIAPGLVGHVIAGIECRWARMLQPGLSAARSLVVGREVSAVRRRGKFVVIELGRGGPAIVIHLRMSGRLDVVASRERIGEHVRARFRLSGEAELRFDDARKFGRVVVATAVESFLSDVGVEPLSDEFVPSLLGNLMRSRARQLKPLLLDQRVVSGLGNIYTDETLHRARLHPMRRSDGLTDAEVKCLHRCIRETLREGLAANGASIDWVYPGGTMQERFRVYGRTGEPCMTCGTNIQRIVVGQRGTHLCPKCQRMSKADRKGRTGVRRL